MCGICGMAHADVNRSVDPELLRRMTDSMVHRGPDSSGLFCVPGVGLGIRRLSIIDLETGDQPIANEDGTITVVCNGEIYNYLELRQKLLLRGHTFRTHSDVEVLVHLYEEHGPELVHRLRGMFGFALWDSRRRQLLLARDRMGIKPLNYARFGQGICFASENKAILASGLIEKRLSRKALGELFSWGFVLAPHTLHDDVFRLPPGHYLTYREGQMAVHRYWQPAFPSRNDFQDKPEEEWCRQLREKLEETVRLHLRSDVAVGSWLSAGLDSSTIAALAGQVSAQPVATYSLSFEDPACDEVRTQPVLSDFPHYRLQGRKFVFRLSDFDQLRKAVWHTEELSLSAVEVPRMALARQVAADGKVVLTGEGADELLGGYRWYHGDRVLRPCSRLPDPLIRGISRMLLRRWRPRTARLFEAPLAMGWERFHAMVAPNNWEIMRHLLRDDVLENVPLPPAPVGFRVPDDFARWAPFCQLQYLDMCLRLPNYIIPDVDRSSMAWSVEARLPFLDHELIEFCSLIPPRLKMKRLTEKWILRKAMEKVLPAAICWRRKRGMEAPVRAFFSRPLPEFARELLSPQRLRETGVFNPAAVGSLLTAHQQGAADYSRQLMGVLSIEIWQELFLKNSPSF